MRLLLAAALLAAAAPALGASTDAVRRGELALRVRITGAVVPDDVFRLKSTIEGRVESLDISSRSWAGATQALATLADKELAAMIEARGGQDQQILEDRWSRMYRPTPVRCPDECYVLKGYIQKGMWVKPQTLLFEAASRLKLVGRVRPGDAALIRDGMPLTFWDVKDPKRRLTGSVARFVLDVQGEKAAPGGTFALYLNADRSLDPGTEVAGEIIAMKKSDVLMVPTAALIIHDGIPYLPIRVSTGLTSVDFTQVVGIDEKRDVLVLDDSQLHGEARHAPPTDAKSLAKVRGEINRSAPPPPSEEPGVVAAPPPAPAPPPPPAPKPDVKPRARQPETLDENGEDPYGEQ